MEHLEWVIRHETLTEIVSMLSPLELFIAECRADGMSDATIGTQLGMTRRHVCHIMVAAQRRIIEELPDAADWLKGRRLMPRRDT